MRRNEIVWNIVIGGVILIIGAGVWAYRNAHPDTFVVTEPELTSPEAIKEVQVPEVMVHLSGAIQHPGIYTVVEGTRVADVVMVAGGFRPDADADSVNLASLCKDGKKIHIKSRKTAATEALPSIAKIHINSATLDELLLVPGIGPKLAHEIIDHRNLYGPFRHIEQIQEVAGLKAKTYEKILPFIEL